MATNLAAWDKSHLLSYRAVGLESGKCGLGSPKTNIKVLSILVSYPGALGEDTPPGSFILLTELISFFLLSSCPHHTQHGRRVLTLGSLTPAAALLSPRLEEAFYRPQVDRLGHLDNTGQYP